ncbi:uncharacterized protein GIQ15_06854 [Arthroderma uncinatum]|uniref:uncharacterized protein n=1 Tax=Arthroderma uncinatum TaxID=74035 RepID=UPI00144A7330|nr:uncharacterized protein GIQ15_06854 [Arthroderma uncinatum]KAF3479878.1 hypothetical protein GIQ15_06854 [Arthroderma uncinatum]
MAADSAASRVRENQRRSRARRKEYIQDLETRLQRYERHGVDVTIEVQAAARKVARQNAMLRSLLNSFGLSDSKIDEYLFHAEGSTAIPVPEKRPVVVPHTPTTHAVTAPPVPICRPGGCSASQKPPEVPSPDVDRAHNPVQQACSGDVADTASPQVDGPGELPDPISPGGSAEPWVDNMTPCEEAARIIASMRGNCDEEVVRAELGCSSNMSCMVGNMSIFQALDR